MALTLRFATARDIAAIARVCVESLPDDPTFDYLWRYRHEYPEDNYFFWLQRLKGNLSTQAARQWQKQGWLDWIQGLATSVENWAIAWQYQHRDADMLRVEAFKQVMDEVYDTYWRKAFPDNWHLELLFTHPDHRKQGAATKIVQWGLTRAEEEGVDLGLESSPMGFPLYQSLGFVLIEKRTVRVDGDKAELGVLVMHKPSSQ
ncbi:hypothetical protein AYO20_11308 [Fonsecaea nubica]|uniref:N-acetyltransferase domain-containing protein n=1 Tax=Fonsecaea nubica TaxID=856822 RepID=A0A178BW80_9EURO|nr:hypothetical protein AYO20_11308 [Fonsecaea nubica]OAL21879.1 hypothetical protein AYO20_11308 [Fonsecaea nubica]